MAWTQTQKDVFTRPLGENERLIKLIGDAGQPLNREHWSITATVTIRPTGALASTGTLARLLGDAWAHVRLRHPSIAAEVGPDGQSLVYTVPRAIEQWTSDTFTVISTVSSAAEVIPTLRPTPSARLIYIPHSDQLLLHTAHWRSDGIGVLLLLHDLLTLLTTTTSPPTLLPWGTEPPRLAPSVEQAASMPATPTPELKARAESLVHTFSHTLDAVGIPSLGDASTLPAGTRSTVLTLPPALTSKIIAASKSHNLTVTSALHASVAGANYALADPSSSSSHYTSTIRFALRPHIPVSSPAGLYTTGWMSRVERDASWSERARIYQSEYHKGVTPEFLEAHREYASQLCDVMRSAAAAAPADTPPSDVDISSVGVVEQFLDRSYGAEDAGVDVVSVQVGVEVLTRQAVTFVWTFRDCLNLGVVYNEAFHSGEQIRRFVDAVREQLQEGLGVE